MFHAVFSVLSNFIRGEEITSEQLIQNQILQTWEKQAGISWCLQTWSFPCYNDQDYINQSDLRIKSWPGKWLQLKKWT